MQITITLSDTDGQRFDAALTAQTTTAAQLLTGAVQSFVQMYEAAEAAKNVPAPVTVTVTTA